MTTETTTSTHVWYIEDTEALVEAMRHACDGLNPITDDRFIDPVIDEYDRFAQKLHQWALGGMEHEIPDKWLEDELQMLADVHVDQYLQACAEDWDEEGEGPFDLRDHGADAGDLIITMMDVLRDHSELAKVPTLVTMWGNSQAGPFPGVFDDLVSSARHYRRSAGSVDWAEAYEWVIHTLAAARPDVFDEIYIARSHRLSERRESDR